MSDLNQVNPTTYYAVTETDRIPADRMTHIHTQPFYCSMGFVWDNLGEPVPEETFTHSHLSWSSIVHNLLLPSNTIHGILPVQSKCLAVFFHNLSPRQNDIKQNLQFFLYYSICSYYCADISNT